MEPSIFTYLLVMSAVTLAIRILPLTLIRGEVKSPFLRSFLYYVPYVTLAVMTFPAMTQATQSPVSGTLALLAGLVLAWWGASLFKVAAACCAGAGYIGILCGFGLCVVGELPYLCGEACVGSNVAHIVIEDVACAVKAEGAGACCVVVSGL